jgi:hypothetical protein
MTHARASFADGSGGLAPRTPRDIFGQKMKGAET